MVKNMFRLVRLSMLLLISGLSQAQESRSVPIPPEFPQRITILYVLDFDEDFFFIAQEAAHLIWDDFSGSFPVLKETWYHILEAALVNSEKVAQVLRGAEGTDPFTQAVSERIPVFIHVRISGDIDRAMIQVRYTFRGVFSELYRFDNSFETPVLEEDDLITHFWLPLTFDLDAFLAKTVIRPPLLIQGPAGALVYGFSQKPIRIPDSEYIFVDVPIPGTYRWKMKHKRYIKQGGVFMADREHLVLTLPRERFSFSALLRILDGNPKTLEPESAY